jgi:hypothetical protein
VLRIPISACHAASSLANQIVERKETVYCRKSVNRLLIPLVCVGICFAPAIKAQNASPGNGSPAPRAPRAIHVSPKPPNHRMPTANVRRPMNFMAYADAVGRYQHARHTRFWWKRHFTAFVLVGGGYYYFDSGYWFPAWGYDPNYEAYDYDGPIFTYGNLLPDQVIVNVQRALQDLGYFAGAISGSLSPATRRAIAAYQQDEGLEVNGVVDGPTVYALGLI